MNGTRGTKRTFYGYKLAYEEDETAAEAVRELKALQGIVREIKRKGNVVRFRSHVDLTTGRRNAVTDKVDYLGGEGLRATRPMPPSALADARYARKPSEIEYGGAMPGKGELYYSHVGMYRDLGQARDNVEVLRDSPLVFQWRRDGKNLSVISRVQITKIPGFKRFDEYPP